MTSTAGTAGAEAKRRHIERGRDTFQAVDHHPAEAGASSLFVELRGRVCRWPEVQRITGLSRPGLYKAMKRGDFPRPINISRQSVGWIGDEIADFLAARINERDEPNQGTSIRSTS